MKKLSLLLLLNLSSFLLFAQKNDQKALETVIDLLKKGMIDGNRNVLEQCTHPNLSYGHSSGKVETRAQFIDAIASGSNNFESIDLTEQSIIITGNLGVVRHHFKAITIIDGKPSSANIAVLQVYQKTGKKWLLLARQAVKV
jgi:Domain of unknown function (DUF4440)